jgi:hypothetical protein
LNSESYENDSENFYRSPENNERHLKDYELVLKQEMKGIYHDELEKNFLGAIETMDRGGCDTGTFDALSGGGIGRRRI